MDDARLAEIEQVVQFVREDDWVELGLGEADYETGTVRQFHELALQALPELVAEIRRLQAEVAELEDRVDTYQSKLWRATRPWNAGGITNLGERDGS
jgi:uncharacterized protein YceH (UPF0502 family)